MNIPHDIIRLIDEEECNSKDSSFSISNQTDSKDSDRSEILSEDLLMDK